MSGLTQRLSEFAAAHLGTPGQVAPLRLFVQLLSSLRPGTTLALTLCNRRSLFSEGGAGLLGQLCDRLLLTRRLGGLADVLLGGLALLLRCHALVHTQQPGSELLLPSDLDQVAAGVVEHGGCD